MDDINVQLINMDTKIPEQLVKNNDDSYTIFLNSGLSKDSQLKSYYHALKHIKGNDFGEENVQEIEYITHGFKKTKERISDEDRFKDTQSEKESKSQNSR